MTHYDKLTHRKLRHLSLRFWFHKTIAHAWLSNREFTLNRTMHHIKKMERINNQIMQLKKENNNAEN